jgi:hypothetical protein
LNKNESAQKFTDTSVFSYNDKQPKGLAYKACPVSLNFSRKELMNKINKPVCIHAINGVSGCLQEKKNNTESLHTGNLFLIYTIDK